MSNEELKEEN